jgi:hypothetical protein
MLKFFNHPVQAVKKSRAHLHAVHSIETPRRLESSCGGGGAALAD